MSDVEDGFVEVNYQSSSDSEWEHVNCSRSNSSNNSNNNSEDELEEINTTTTTTTTTTTNTSAYPSPEEIFSIPTSSYFNCENVIESNCNNDNNNNNNCNYNNAMSPVVVNDLKPTLCVPLEKVETLEALAFETRKTFESLETLENLESLEKKLEGWKNNNNSSNSNNNNTKPKNAWNQRLRRGERRRVEERQEDEEEGEGYDWPPVITPIEIPRVHQQQQKESNGRRKKWTPIITKRGFGDPNDPVAYLGISEADATLLSHYCISTIGQLANFDVLALIACEDPFLPRLLDLQETALETATAFITKASIPPEIVWGYCYMSYNEHKQILKQGHFYNENSTFLFLWSPIPANVYGDCVIIDKIVGRETKDKSIRDRYAHLVKINITKLVQKYNAGLFKKQVHNSDGKWRVISLEATESIRRQDDMFDKFVPGSNVYQFVPHACVVVNSKKIPQDCIELTAPYSFETTPNIKYGNVKRQYEYGYESGTESESEYESSDSDPTEDQRYLAWDI